MLGTSYWIHHAGYVMLGTSCWVHHAGYIKVSLPALVHSRLLVVYTYYMGVISIEICQALFSCKPCMYANLVPSLSARQIFIAYSMKNRRGKSGSKRHDDACRNVTNLTSRISPARAPP